MFGNKMKEFTEIEKLIIKMKFSLDEELINLENFWVIIGFIKKNYPQK